MMFIADNDEDVKRIAEPVLENILLGLKNDDYGIYSKDFDEMMKTAIPESNFGEIRHQIENLLGSITGKEYMGFLNRETATLTLWKGCFSDTANDVLIELTCSNLNGRVFVNGLWFK